MNFFYIRLSFDSYINVLLFIIYYLLQHCNKDLTYNNGAIRFQQFRHSLEEDIYTFHDILMRTKKFDMRL